MLKSHGNSALFNPSTINADQTPDYLVCLHKTGNTKKVLGAQTVRRSSGRQQPASDVNVLYTCKLSPSGVNSSRIVACEKKTIVRRNDVPNVMANKKSNETRNDIPADCRFRTICQMIRRAACSTMEPRPTARISASD